MPRKLTVVQECAKLWSAIVRAKGKCEKCGTRKAESLQAAHVLPKGKYPNLKYDLLNGLCLCWQCHMHWWHKNPLEASDWFKKSFPSRYQYLQEQKVLVVRRRASDFRDLFAFLTEAKEGAGGSQ